jgi:adenylate kinase family enzyme
MAHHYALDSHIKVEKISLRGPGCIILTGPSSCGKGEVAAALCRVMSIPPQAHLSMGEILRTTIHSAKHDEKFRTLLSGKYQIDANTNIYDCIDTTPELTRKVLSHAADLEKFFFKTGMGNSCSQLEWLEFCTLNGLLVPNRWTQEFIAAHVEHDPALRTRPFILDGYPRRPEAAQHLLKFLDANGIPIIKVIHLSISKQEMISRASHRGRADDDQASLLSRYNFYVDSVQPTVDYLKMELGSAAIALIDAHQPVYDQSHGERKFNLEASIQNVVVSVLRNLGVPRSIMRDLLAQNSKCSSAAHLV